MVLKEMRIFFCEVFSDFRKHPENCTEKKNNY